MGRRKNTNKVPALASFLTITTALQATEDDKEVWALLMKERRGLNRYPFVKRIYGRFAVLRSLRERRELGIV